MAVIDVHAHAFPDEVAGRAMSKLEAMAEWEPVGDGTVGGLIQSLDAGGADAAVICTIATKPDQTEGILDWCRQVRSERIIPFPSVHPQADRKAQWLKRFRDEGFRGIKLHTMYQDFVADDPKMDDLYGAATECGLVVAMHCGYDIAFPTDERALPQRIARVADRHPDMKLLCTHLGGWKAWDGVERHLVGRDVYFETSFAARLLGLERAADMIRRHGAGRVMFGTDWPWNAHSEDVADIMALDLTDDQKQAILGPNAARLLDL